MRFFERMVAETRFAKQTATEKAAIDEVLFSLWARGHLQRPIWASTFLIILSALVGPIRFLFSLPAKLFRNLHILIFAFGIAFSLDAYMPLSQKKNFIGFVLIFLICKYKEIIKTLRVFVFDTFDLITLSTLSRRFARRVLALGPLRDWKDDDDADLRAHLAVSRTLTSGEFCKEADAVQDFINGASMDEAKLCETIEEYWRNFPRNSHFWRDQIAGAKSGTGNHGRRSP